jgi:acetylornithine deacetylase/succinyl-diaminopimelate desuccinylase-like protein
VSLDPERLAAERERLAPAFAYVDRHADVFVERLQRLARMPSVSAHLQSLPETAKLVEELARDVGVETEQIPLDGGPPLVYGKIVGTGPRTLQLYNHYDVQPEDPLDLWHSDPWAAELRDGRVWGRGVSDNKGNLVARLCAMEAYQQAIGKLPLTVSLLYEGEEEVGSPHLHQFTNTPRGRDLVTVDGCVWEGGSTDSSGRPVLGLGCKGDVYVELRTRSAGIDLHSSWASVVPNAAWRLTWALATLKDPNTHRCLIPGFYDRVQPPSARSLELADREPLSLDELSTLFGVESLMNDWDGGEARRHYLFDPTCTISGLTSGYQGPGSKTVLPAEATAKVDFRLVPDQDPVEIIRLLRRHLDAHGFRDVEIVEIEGEGERASRTDPDHPFVGIVADTARLITGQEPIIMPTMAGTGPQHVLCGQFGVPAVSTGIGNPQSNAHAPNENIVVADYLQGIKHMVLLFDRFGRSGAVSSAPGAAS